VTVVTTEDDIEPAMAMGSSLRAFTRTSESVDNPSYAIDYICLVLPKFDPSRQTESQYENEEIGINMLGAKKLEFAGWSTRLMSYSISNTNSESSNWKEMDYNRIWIWSLAEYEKIVYLDTDMLTIQDINELFEVDLWSDDTSVQFAAAPQLFASHKFDSGLMLLKPDISTFTEMLSSIKAGVESLWVFDDFINDFFSGWHFMSQAHRLLPTYNAPYAWTQDEKWVSYRSDIKIVHFTGKEKPWLILRDPTQFQVSKYGAPLIYVWAILLFFIANPLGDGLEEETRYVLTEVFDITKSSKKVAQYIEKMKRGGTRIRLGLQATDDKEEL